MTAVAELLESLSAAAPDLQGAACVAPEHRALFDRAADGKVRTARRKRDVEPALQVCAGCPVLAECKAWVRSLPRGRRPSGVVGGMVVVAPRVVARSAAKQKWG